MSLRFGKEIASYMPILMKIVNMTNGPILELGAGLFSTPYLHWACYDKKRKLVSYEGKSRYFEMVQQYDCDYHKIYQVGNNGWDGIDIDTEHWSVVLVDHAPLDRRKKEAIRLSNIADYIVLHDSDEEHDESYKYSEIYPLFKYRYDTVGLFSRTTVISNLKDLSNL